MDLGGFLPSRRRKANGSCRPSHLRALPEKHRRPGNFNHDGVRAGLQTIASEHRQASSRSCPTSRPPAWKACFASSAWNQRGQLYAAGRRPTDVLQESKDGQILQEESTSQERCVTGSPTATSYSTHGVQTIQTYIFSMFGFQRIGDLAWAREICARAGSSWRNRRTRRSTAKASAGRCSHVIAATVRTASRTTRRSDMKCGDRPGRIAPDARGAGGRLLLPDGDERKLSPACPKALPPSQACTCSRAATRAEPRAVARLRDNLPRGYRRVEVAAQRLGSTRTCGAARASPNLHAKAQQPARWNMLSDRQADCPRRACSSSQGPVIAATDYVARSRIKSGRSSSARRPRHDGLAVPIPRKAAKVLRGRSLLRDGRGAEGAGRRGCASAAGGRGNQERYRRVEACAMDRLI